MRYLWLLFFISFNVFSQEVPLDIKNYSIKGYVYQGYTKSNNNNYIGNSSSDGGSLQNRDIGVMGSYILNQNIDLRGFAKIEQQGNRFADPLHFSYALMDLHTNVNDTILGLRLGKIRNVVGFYNATMEDPITRDLDLQPVSIYIPTLKSFLNGGIGYQAYVNTNDLPFVNVSVDFSMLNPRFYPREDVLSTWFCLVPKGYFDSATSNMTSVSLGATTKDLQWALHWDSYKVKANYISGASDFIPAGDYGMQINLLGIRKYFNNFDVTYEVLNAKRIGAAWEVLYPNYKAHIEGSNFSIRYVPDYKLSYIFSVDAWATSNLDKDGTELHSTMGVLAANGYIKDYSIGVKYLATPNIILRGSYHNLKGLVGLSPLDNPNFQYSGSPTDSLYTLSFTYIF